LVAGRFRLESCIGSSGDTLVFRATQVALGRAVAVKLLLAPADDAQQLGARLRREAKVVASLEHPAIATVFDQGVTEDGLPFIAMELLDGENLEEYLARLGRLSLDEAVELVTAIAAALAAVHRAGFVHRDVKPANVFLVRNGQGGHDIKLIDFGIARQVATRFQGDAFTKQTLAGLGGGTLIHTLPGIVFGTPWYMSPEQCRGPDVDWRTDVYSLACVFYDLLTGRPPFDDDEPTRVMARHLAVEPDLPSKVVPDAGIPEAVDAVVMKALAKEPARRYQTVDLFASTLVRARTQAVYVKLDGDAGPADRPRSDAPIAIPTVAVSWRLLLLMGAAVLCVAVWLWTRVAFRYSEAAPSRTAREQKVHAVGSATRATATPRRKAVPERGPDSGVRSIASSRARVQRTSSTPGRSQAPKRLDSSAADPNYSLQELKVPRGISKEPSP
jgi:serine/threonine protein kinase